VNESPDHSTDFGWYFREQREPILYGLADGLQDGVGHRFFESANSGLEGHDLRFESLVFCPQLEILAFECGRPILDPGWTV
jgi:hypothetical protein